MKTLLIQDYLRSGKTLEDLVVEHGVYSKITNGKIALSYDQLEAKNTDPIACECRGLVLEENTYNIVAFPLMRFFNDSQVDLIPKDFDWESAKYQTKMDGCCDEDTVLITEDGEKTIKQICDDKYLGKILSYSFNLYEIEFCKILGHSVQENIDNWYEIELENGKTVKLTGNHKVFLPKLNCYRMVEDLINEDYVLLND